jgi:hypothetical protein
VNLGDKNMPANMSVSERRQRGFTLIELLVIVMVAMFLGMVLLPGLVRLRSDSQAVQCLSNQRQLARAWKMYTEDNSGKIVSAYPAYGGFAGTWCAGNGERGGSAGSYTYGGADPGGIQSGLLWPYARVLGLYHCPTDHRIASDSSVPAQFKGKPILRSISMNSFMDGTGLFPGGSYNPISGGTRNPNYPVYLKESEIKQPKQTFILVDEDQNSINDGMFFMDVAGTRRFLDLPSRAHRFGYGINFADGHAEIIQFRDTQSKTWQASDVPGGGLSDWMRFTNVTTHPL